ncbi:TraR/DksA C4-type zinc finger protein [Saxibacter everestensis]|uniref:TraR/DksA C4-type zinc finger protein n=1 Tax=Saxibacter everestensis TaxID=2909229 RepID=A0ABY8QRA0_9MICO|nr:TraR/DksA C4-type zinc finger protein [Brevibacteriaceae bacterium ZFBP1038]
MPKPSPRENLLAARSDAQRRSEALAHEHADIIAATQFAAIDDEHDPEGSTIAYERTQTAQLLADTHDEVNEIDAALLRVEDGSYGKCQQCGEPIAPARLEALPATRLCLSCAASRR